MGTLLNDIYIERTDTDGNTTQLIKVPLTYSPKDKMLARVTQDPNIDRPSSTVTLPMISFEMGQMTYDRDRKLNTIHRVVVRDDVTPSAKYRYQYNYVPYNIEFKAFVYAKNAEDGTKILEQIIPFFTPAWTTTVRLINDVEEVKDIPVILRNIQYEDTYDGQFTDRRAIVWTLNFVMKAYFFGPVKKSAIIKFVKANFYTPSVSDGDLPEAVGVTPIAEQVLVYPGLTANGEPTSDKNLTIPYLEINEDDDFGYITEILDGEDAV